MAVTSNLLEWDITGFIFVTIFIDAVELEIPQLPLVYEAKHHQSRHFSQSDRPPLAVESYGEQWNFLIFLKFTIRVRNIPPLSIKQLLRYKCFRDQICKLLMEYNKHRRSIARKRKVVEVSMLGSLIRDRISADIRHLHRFTSRSCATRAQLEFKKCCSLRSHGGLQFFA